MGAMPQSVKPTDIAAFFTKAASIFNLYFLCSAVELVFQETAVKGTIEELYFLRGMQTDVLNSLKVGRDEPHLATLAV